MDILKDIYNRSEPPVIMIARPGKRIIGPITGIEPDSVSLTLNFQNTHELSFDVYRYVNGKESLIYSYIDRLMEIFIKGFGWFKIMELPETYCSGNEEYKKVTAESLEIELVGSDLVGFIVNAVTSTSLEILAEDNSYKTDYGLTMYRDRIIFYRDLTAYEEVLNSISVDLDEAEFKTLLIHNPEFIINSWRIRFSGQNIREEFSNCLNYYETIGTDTTVLNTIYEQSINWTEDQWNTQLKKKAVLNNYPELIDYITLSYNFEYEDEILTFYRLLSLEYRRLKDLSLLDLVLKNSPGWTVGYVDDELYEEYNYSLRDSTGKFEIDNQSIYSFLTQNLSQYFSCIFTFDTYNCKVNAYRINSIGKNSNILLGYHDIENDVTITSTYELITKYYVYGTDYDISYVNFGSRYIEDISYFLTEKYMSKELINKYNEWHTYRESVRQDYIDYTRNYNSKLSEANEIKYRVPDDGIDNIQWTTMSNEQLQSTLDNYKALVKGYETYYVDSDGNFDIEAMKTVPTDYDHYYLIKDVIIPNIETVIANREVTSENEEELWNESSRKSIYRIIGTTSDEVIAIYNDLIEKFGIEYTCGEVFQENNYYVLEVVTGYFVAYGNMYGIEELKIQIENFENKANALFKAGYAEITEDSLEYEKAQNQLYLDYQNTLKELKIILEDRQKEYDNINTELKNIQTTRIALVKSVDINNQSGENFTPLNKKELNILSKFYHISDYTNDNIIITSLDDTVTTIDTALELYNDAVEQLYVESHPQTSYKSNLDNFLALIDYEKYVKELEMGDFIRIETEKDYFVKLRLISLTFNPISYDENIDLTFSDIIKYKFKRNDFVSLLNNSSFSSKNSSSIISTNSNSNNTLTIDSDTIKQIINNTYFQNAIGSGGYGSGSGTGMGSGTGGSGGTIITDEILANYIKTTELEAELAKINHLEADSAFIKYLNAELITADNIYTTMLEADQAYIENLAAEMSQFMKVSASNITGVDATFAKLIAGQITVNDLKAGVLTLGSGVSIKNEDGNLIIDSTGMSIYGTDSEGNSYCGVQIGYDAENNPSIILRNSDGALLLTPDGITENAIVDELIVTRMIAPEAVTGDKISWSSVGATTDKDGNVIWNAANITCNDEELSTVISRIETSVDDSNDRITDLENNLPWNLQIFSSNGIVLDRTNSSTTLYVELYYGNENVTSQYQNNFYWTRSSNDETGDESWNVLHSSPTYYVQITRADVVRNAQFTCQLIVDDEVLASQSI